MKRHFISAIFVVKKHFTKRILREVSIGDFPGVARASLFDLKVNNGE